MLPRQAIANVGAENVFDPVVERRVAVDAAALEQIDQNFMNGVDVVTGLDLVLAFGPRERVRKLEPVFIREMPGAGSALGRP